MPHCAPVCARARACARAGLPKRSESGVGALMPWADKLYMISYLSVPDYGAGTGLYEIDEELGITKLMNHSSVFANRMIHHWTDQVSTPAACQSAGKASFTPSVLEYPFFTWQFGVAQSNGSSANRIAGIAGIAEVRRVRRGAGLLGRHVLVIAGPSS